MWLYVYRKLKVHFILKLPFYVHVLYKTKFLYEINSFSRYKLSIAALCRDHDDNPALTDEENLMWRHVSLFSGVPLLEESELEGAAEARADEEENCGAPPQSSVVAGAETKRGASPDRA